MNFVAAALVGVVIAAVAAAVDFAFSIIVCFDGSSFLLLSCSLSMLLLLLFFL